MVGDQDAIHRRIRVMIAFTDSGVYARLILEAFGYLNAVLPPAVQATPGAQSAVRRP